MSAWENPYTETNRRATLAATNRERVLRQKKEREFLRGLQDKFQMEQMEQVEANLEEANKVRLLDMRAAQNRARSVTPRTAPAPERPAITTVSRLEAQLRCFFPTHGGATLWTGEADGCIGIRNGTDGSLSYRIAKTEGLFVDCIYQSAAQHMWIGLSDGTVRIYDPIVFILLFEGKKHQTAVTTFAETFDGKMFSASVDGTLVKWDSEAHEFECMMEVPPPEGEAASVRSIACYGYNVFVAADSPVIRCIDAETGAETRAYEGHDGTVTCVAVLDGYLWSGAADGTIGVWTIDDAVRVAALDLHRTGVTGLMVDDIGHTVWSTDESGEVHVWHSSPDRDFAHIRSYTPDAAAAVRSIKGFVAVDASKLWSLGGNGINFVWHSATNRVERSTKQAVLAMEHIIDQDSKELERWAAVLANLKAVAARLRQTMATELGRAVDRTQTHHAFFVWMRHAQRKLWRKRLPSAAEGLAQAADNDLRARYLCTLNRFRVEQHRKRHVAQVSTALASHQKNELIVAYYYKAQAHYRLMRQRILAKARMQGLLATNERALAATAFARLLNFRAQRKRAQKRDQMAAALAVAAERTVMQGCYSAWSASIKYKRLGRAAVQRATALRAMHERNSLAAYYYKWLQFRHQQKTGNRRAKLAAVAARRNNRVMIAAAYWKWQRFVAIRAAEAAEARLLAVRSETAALQGKLDAVEHLTGRQKLSADVDRLVEITRANIEAKKARLAAIGEEIDTIVAETAEKRSGRQEEVAKSISEQVDDLIAMLKAKLINVHQDYSLTHKIIEKCKNVPASKLFLESHAAVKRIVVDLTHQPMLGSEDVWPLSEAKIKSLPKHHAESVLTAIKSMIITFDILSPEERSSLATDNEIAINAHWLKAFAERCIAARKAALGKAMYRVKK